MQFNARRLFPFVVAILAIGALLYAVTFGTLPPADFTFINGTEVQSIDPGKVTGVPEHRIISALFEGLFGQDPKTLAPIPAVAERYELSEDKKTYTFFLRKESVWSDESPVTAKDFWWSWRRVLHPETAGEYAYQLYYLKNAEKYNTASVEAGDRVEVELNDRVAPTELFPRGTLVRGVLREIVKPAAPEISPQAGPEEKKKQRANWKKRWTYVVETADGSHRSFSKEDRSGKSDSEKCLSVLLDFDEVGVHVIDTDRLQVELNHATPFFLHLMAFYTTYPVNRACIERHGRDWTKPKNLINNGPYKLQFRRLRDRIRLVKNASYWNADQVDLETIDALAVNSLTTGLNMYVNGQVDWSETIPPAVVPEMMEQYSKEVRSAPMLTTYMYRINTRRAPLRDPRVRRALNMTVNKQEICEWILRAGQQPARALVPPGMSGYEQALCADYNVQEARRLLAEAGYPGGKGIRRLEILYNDQETHKTIAEKIQSDWAKNLGIRTELKGMEWGVYLDAVNRFDYDIARYAWVGDYPDPNTFLDMFVTDGTNNRTGWGSPRYDELIDSAASQSDPQTRMRTFRDAEQILMDAQPIIPIYFYVSLNLVRPYVQGFHSNIQNVHPLHALRIDQEEKTRFLNARRNR